MVSGSAPLTPVKVRSRKSRNDSRPISGGTVPWRLRPLRFSWETRRAAQVAPGQLQTLAALGLSGHQDGQARAMERNAAQSRLSSAGPQAAGAAAAPRTRSRTSPRVRRAAAPADAVLRRQRLEPIFATVRLEPAGSGIMSDTSRPRTCDHVHLHSKSHDCQHRCDVHACELSGSLLL